MYDKIFKKCMIYDGSGKPPFMGDIAVKDGKIAAVGTIKENGAEMVDCYGLSASPGFIDIHNHSDTSVFTDLECKNYISQGVTTVLNGNCGGSHAPVTNKNFSIAENVQKEFPLQGCCTFEDYMKAMDSTGFGANMASLVGHNTVRSAIMGDKDSKPTEEELNKMKEEVRLGMEAGAFGFSTGLSYSPSIFADTEEIVELAKVCAEYGGIYCTHMRNESDELIDSVMEAIEVGSKSGCRVEISHFKAFGLENFGDVKTALDIIEYYNRRGMEITCDVYPCTFSFTGLYACIPNFARVNGPDGFKLFIADEDRKKKLISYLGSKSLMGVPYDEYIIAAPKQERYSGKSILEISKILNMTAPETVVELLTENVNTNIIRGGISEDDMKFVLKHPLSMIGSDGKVRSDYESIIHPRSYRAFTKVLSDYARDEKIISVSEAIKKMTSYPAWKIGLYDRGMIKPGMVADLHVFDLDSVEYKADYSKPHQYSQGSVYVLVNGEYVIKNNTFTGNLPGKMLKKKNC